MIIGIFSSFLSKHLIIYYSWCSGRFTIYFLHYLRKIHAQHYILWYINHLGCGLLYQDGAWYKNQNFGYFPIDRYRGQFFSVSEQFSSIASYDRFKILCILRKSFTEKSVWYLGLRCLWHINFWRFSRNFNCTI